MAPRTGICGTKAEPVEDKHLLYSFLTTEPNSSVAPKAMPVILTTPDEYDMWLNAPDGEAFELHCPLPDDLLEIVSEGFRSDPLGKTIGFKLNQHSHRNKRQMTQR